MKCSEHFLEKILLHLSIHGKHSASLQWGLSETRLQSQLGTAAGFQLLFPLFRQKDPGVLWDGVGVSGGRSAVFPPLSVPRWASVKGKAWPMVPSCGAALCGSSGAAGEPPGLGSRGVPPVSPPLQAWQALGWPQPLVLGWAARARRDGVVPGEPVRVGTLGGAPLGPQAWSPPPCSSGPEQGTACLFPVPAGKGWVPASFPVCVPPRRSPAAWPSPIQTPRAPSCPVGWCWAGWAAWDPTLRGPWGPCGQEKGWVSGWAAQPSPL